MRTYSYRRWVGGSLFFHVTRLAWILVRCVQPYGLS
jgi:hypothetical protein